MSPLANPMKISSLGIQSLQSCSMSGDSNEPSEIVGCISAVRFYGIVGLPPRPVDVVILCFYQQQFGFGQRKKLLEIMVGGFKPKKNIDKNRSIKMGS